MSDVIIKMADLNKPKITNTGDFHVNIENT